MVAVLYLTAETTGTSRAYFFVCLSCEDNAFEVYLVLHDIVTRFNTKIREDT